MTAAEKKLVPAFCVVLGCKEAFIQTRLNVLGHGTVCGRCCGSGSYSFCQQYGTMCFGCSGSGKAPTKLTATLLKEVTKQVEDGGLVAYVENLKHKAAMKAKVKGVHEKMMNAWKNLPTIVKDKAEGRDHHTRQSARQTDLNDFCHTLVTEADKLESEVKNGIWSKELKGYVKVSDEQVEKNVTRLLEILSLIEQAETLAPYTRWDEKTKRRVVVS